MLDDGARTRDAGFEEKPENDFGHRQQHHAAQRHRQAQVLDSDEHLPPTRSRPGTRRIRLARARVTAHSDFPPWAARYSFNKRCASSKKGAGTSLPRICTFSTTARHSASISAVTFCTFSPRFPIAVTADSLS